MKTDARNPDSTPIPGTFGLEHNSTTANNFKYSFQGQERQDEYGLTWSSFKWRNEDLEIGRFFYHDPLSEKYYYNSPYAFSENDLIRARELEGLEKLIVNNVNVDSRSATLTIKKVILMPTSGPRSVQNGNVTSSGVSTIYSKRNTTLYTRSLPQSGEKTIYISKSAYINGKGVKLDVVYDVSVKTDVTLGEASNMAKNDPATYSLFSSKEGINPNVAGEADTETTRNFAFLNANYFGGDASKELGNAVLTGNEVVAHELGHNMTGIKHITDSNGNYIYPTKGLQSNQTGQIYPTTKETKSIIEINNDRIEYEK